MTENLSSLLWLELSRHDAIRVNVMRLAGYELVLIVRLRPF